MSGPAQGIPTETRQKFAQMREDIKKITNTLQDVESQHSEYRYVFLNGEVDCGPSSPIKAKICFGTFLALLRPSFTTSSRFTDKNPDQLAFT